MVLFDKLFTFVRIIAANIRSVYLSRISDAGHLGLDHPGPRSAVSAVHQVYIHPICHLYRLTAYMPIID